MIFLLKNLGSKPDSSFYAHYLKEKIEKMLGLWASNLDPLKYRKLYVKKVNLEGPPILAQGTQMGSQINFSRQTTEEKETAIKFQEHDIVGLTIMEVSSKGKTKYNTLRTHLSWPEHPVVNIMQSFREKLVQCITERTKAINMGAKFYEQEARTDYMREQNKRLLDYCISEIKGFVTAIHDAVIRFYQLDVKVSHDTDQSECLTNLLTSLVLKSPVYTEIHSLIQIAQKESYKKVAATVTELRKKYDLQEVLDIDECKMGRNIVLIKARKAFRQQNE